MSSSHLHIFTILAGLAVLGLIIRLITGRGRTRAGDSVLGGFMACIFSGVLLANAIPHFVHGISGEHFPAPFGYLLGTGVWDNISNVVWGFINIVLGLNLLQAGRVFKGERWRLVLFFAGFLGMAILLSVIFTKGSHSVLRVI
ncbi:MAG TPA: hypothetical protein VH637_20190 [Streptosporangiaceae bacterium]|jgi:hypothetical protein